jgi:hypothetical protein
MSLAGDDASAGHSPLPGREPWPGQSLALLPRLSADAVADAVSHIKT